MYDLLSSSGADAYNLDDSQASLLNAALGELDILLRDFAGSPTALHKLQATFDFDTPEVAEDYLDNLLLNGSFAQFLEIQILNEDSIRSSGAYSAENNKIYLSSSLFRGDQTSLVGLVDIISEEYGHAVDELLSPGLDSQGDEGELFSLMLRQGEVDSATIEALKSEDDSGWVVVDGDLVAVEQAVPNSLSFETTQSLYSPGDNVSLGSGWVYDADGAADLNYVDFWLRKDNGAWQNISDATSFTPWSGDNNWASFDFSLGALATGNYDLWGIAYDDSGVTSNSYTTNFSVFNSAPTSLSFSTTKSTYSPGENVSLGSGWVYDADGADDINYVDLWLRKDGGTWQNISDATSFTPWSGNNDWGSFAGFSLGALGTGSYELWGTAYDDSGAFSNSYTTNFSVLASNDVNLKTSSFNVVQEPLDTGDSFTVDFNIQNTEAGSAGPFDVNFYISTNDIISAADQFLGSYTVNGLAGNSSTGTLSSTFTLPTAGSSFWNGDATYYIGMIVDEADVINETNESDNRNQGEFIDYDGVFVNIDDAYEQNDTRLTAYDLSFNEQTWLSNLQGLGVQADDDWYEINITPGFENLQVDLQFAHADGDIDLQVYDALGNLVGSAASATDNEFLNINLASSGTHYLRVYGFNGDTNNTYDLWWDDLAVSSGNQALVGTLSADTFTVQTGVAQTIVSGNGNVEFGQGQYDLLDLSSISSSSVNLSYATSLNGGMLYNPGNGARLFDLITLNNGNQILFEGIDRILFSDQIVDLFVEPNDTHFSDQWNLHMMGVHNAWRFTTGSTGVLIGVQDTGLGVDSNGNIHDDLRTTTIFSDNYEDDYFREINDGNYGPKSTSHGTAVQGIIAAQSNNGIGIAGINWNSDVFAIDVLDGNTNDQNYAQAAQNMIDEANANGQKLIVNMSLSGGGGAAFDNLVANNPDVLFVATSGNNDKDSLNYPGALAATYSNFMAIGASWGQTDAYNNTTTPGDRITYPGWWGSNYGTGLTLMGPSEVYTTQASKSFGTVTFNYTSGFNGTSAAAPNVSGVASLVWSANPNLTAGQVREILSQTAYDLGAQGYDTEHGHGFVNADAAVRRALAIS